MVTHDRYFLDRVTNGILEFDKGKTYSYQGNYSEFLTQKAERIERENAAESKRQNFLRNELAWIQRGAQARSTKQKARIQRYEEVKKQKVDLTRNQVEIGLAGSRLGRKRRDETSMADSSSCRKCFPGIRPAESVGCIG